MALTLHHPTRYTWDFWYYYDTAEKSFHVFYLNADPALVPEEKHHWTSRVSYATTRDFHSIQWGPDDVLTASPDRWDNSSIWTGDIVRIKNGFLMFYTSRNLETDNGKTQNIGVAYADRINAVKWQPIPDFRLRPDGINYASCGIPEDVTIHAWRDPFLFRHLGQTYMLISAKSVRHPIKQNGVVALLRSGDGTFKNWDYLNPVAAPGYYSEMEVSQLLKNPDGGLELVFSTGPKYDSTPHNSGTGGLYRIHLDENLSVRSEPELLYSFQSGLYACRIIPEMEGEIVGFDHRTGGIRASGIKTGFQYIDRNFNNWRV